MVGKTASTRQTEHGGESWFGALGEVSPEEASRAYQPTGILDTQPSGDVASDEDAWYQQDAVDSSLFVSQARQLGSTEDRSTAFQRIYRLFLSARAALGGALLLAQLATALLGVGVLTWSFWLSASYSLLAFLVWLWPDHLTPRRQTPGMGESRWLLTIGVDVSVFLALHAVAPAGSFNYVALLVMPVLMAGVLTPRRHAVATASMVSLLLLAMGWWDGVRLGDQTAMLTQAGLSGAGLFVITMLAGEMAGRLAREEQAAKGSKEVARQQAELNRLVIQEMQDGVLVVDRTGRVRAANPAARRLIVLDGMSGPAPFQLRGVSSWSGLVRTVEDAFVAGTWPEAGLDVSLTFQDGGVRVLRVRVRFTHRDALVNNEDFCVLLLEDVRSMAARSRQEKLAAMGRVSAGIAHEIRNPLAAISQANALLSEDELTPQQRRLARMVSDNVERLKRIVDDVMEVAPGGAPSQRVVDVVAQVRLICDEWRHTVGLDGAAAPVLETQWPTQALAAVFEPEHLRRVLVNLLENALRHCSRTPGAMLVRVSASHGERLDQEGLDGPCVLVQMFSDGTPIEASVERHLFEPFFSTSSRGAGLGLYICRELAERYGAVMEYRAQPRATRLTKEFFLAMPQRHIADIT